MTLCLSRFVVLTVLAVVIAGISSTPARACLWMGGWLVPDKPFYAAYLEEGEVIFRGRPIGVRSPKPSTRSHTESRIEEDFKNGSEVTFEVLATYRGVEKEIRTAYQIGSSFIGTSFRKSVDLETFKKEVGDDLLVVLSEPDHRSKQYTDWPMIALGECGELLMRRFSAMEPVLRERGLID
ncbi:hypothetical protein [Pelagibius marinus]|uniref:hypothetical protein n=1 Tax=Pelagibius marinus TaxID=2762760 RepID=UPI00187299F0|nr:hypothetical protein [Pelagibius marinus]